MIRKKEKRERKRNLSWRRESLAMEMTHDPKRLNPDQYVASIVEANAHGVLVVDFYIQV